MDNLDSQELLHLAMHASSQDRHDDAIGHLKKAIDLEPDNAFVCFLLAAEYAQIGLYDRALEFFGKTCDLAPELYVARVQKGLLLTALDRLDEAKETLMPLKELSDDNCYQLFASGLIELIAENLQEAKALIESGIEANKENEPLNGDFQRIVEEINKKLTGEPEDDAAQEDNSSVNSFLLSSYEK